MYQVKEGNSQRQKIGCMEFLGEIHFIGKMMIDNFLRTQFLRQMLILIYLKHFNNYYLIRYLTRAAKGRE